MKYLKKIVA